MSGKLYEILPPDIGQALKDTCLAASTLHRLRMYSLILSENSADERKAPDAPLDFILMVLVPDVIRLHEHQISARRGLDALTDDLLAACPESCCVA
ncbi:MAG: hypothetical protein HOA06_07810 [Chloroflexi bacterium]|nr:hypothetical protein [Chloroflexota bacterium]